MKVDCFQPILNIETRTGLLDPGEVSVTFSKITPSLFTIKEGSTSHPDPLTLRGEGETAPTRRSYIKVVGGIKAPRLIVDATELRLFVRCYTALLGRFREIVN